MRGQTMEIVFSLKLVLNSSFFWKCTLFYLACQRRSICEL